MKALESLRSDCLMAQNEFESQGGGLELLYGFAMIIGVSFVLLTILGAWQTVPEGTEGHISTFGEVSDEPLSPGLHLKVPWIQSIGTLSTRTEAYTMSSTANEGEKMQDDSIDALTTEGLNIKVDLTVRYHMNKGNAPRVYSNIGDMNAVTSKVVRPTIRSSVRSCSAKYSVNAIYSDKRDEFSDCISNRTNDQFQEIKGFDVEAIQLRNVMLPQKVRNAIQEKEATQQQIEQKQNQIEVERKERQRKVIEAKGIAESNQIIGQSLSDAYLKWYWIQEGLKKGDAMYVPVGNGGMPLMKDVDQKPSFSDANYTALADAQQGMAQPGEQ